MHAIGDRGNRIVLDAYEAALKAVPTADHRFRIEHAQILNHDDIPRFAAARRHSVDAGQPPDQRHVLGGEPPRLDPRLGAYAWRSLLNTGVVIPNGSDFPVKRVNPLISFHSAVSRQDARRLAAGRLVSRPSG